MLTRLFSNLSLQSGVSALVMVIGFCIWASFRLPLEEVGLALPNLNGKVNPIFFKVLIIFSIPFISLIYNRLFNMIGVLRSTYHILSICGIQLLMLFLYSPSLDVLLMLWFAVLLYQKIFNLNSVENPKPEIFNIGTLIGLSTLVVPESIFILILVWAAFFVYRIISIKNFIIPLIGIFGTYFVIFSGFFFFSEFDFIRFLTHQFENIRFDFVSYDFEKPIGLIPFFISLLWAIYELVVNIGKATVFKRQILALNLTLVVLLFVIAPTLKQPELLLILGVFPASVLQANLVLRLKKWWVQDLVYLLVISGLLLQLF